MKGTGINDLMISASYSNLCEDIDVYTTTKNNNDKYFYNYEAQWSQEGSNFNWNEGAGKGNRTFSTIGSNPDLGFVHRKEFSLSLRGSFFNKLISAELTYFNTDLDGLIIKTPSDFPSHLSSGIGASTFKPTVNNNIQNRKGLDFSIKAQKQFGQVHAELGFVGTYLDTKWKKYDEVVEADNQSIEGTPIDGLWGYKCVGFYKLADFDVTTTKDGNTKYTLKSGVVYSKVGGTIQPGDLKYEDQNGDGFIEADGKELRSKDKVYLGRSGTYGAPWTVGVNLTLKYKNWTLFMLGGGEFGAVGMMNGSYYYMSGDAKYSVNALGRWTPETGDAATHPRLTTTNHAHDAAASSFWLYSKDRFDLRKVQLTYDFPQEMFEGKVVKALSIYVNGNDLLTFSKHRKMMETSVGYAPQTRFYNVGVKVTL